MNRDLEIKPLSGPLTPNDVLNIAKQLEGNIEVSFTSDDEDHIYYGEFDIKISLAEIYAMMNCTAVPLVPDANHMDRFYDEREFRCLVVHQPHYTVHLAEINFNNKKMRLENLSSEITVDKELLFIFFEKVPAVMIECEVFLNDESEIPSTIILFDQLLDLLEEEKADETFDYIDPNSVITITGFQGGTSSNN